jgi:hypothetical protein
MMATLTKRHFRALAEAINSDLELELSVEDKRKVALAIGRVLKKENPAFDWDTWHKACNTAK